MEIQDRGECFLVGVTTEKYGILEGGVGGLKISQVWTMLEYLEWV